MFSLFLLLSLFGFSQHTSFSIGLGMKALVWDEEYIPSINVQITYGDSLRNGILFMYDMNRDETRTWPSRGDYYITRKRAGVAYTIEYSHYLARRVDLNYQTAAGYQKEVHDVKTDIKFIKNAVVIPKDKTRLFGFIVLGPSVDTKVGKVQLLAGIGEYNVLFKYTIHL